MAYGNVGEENSARINADKCGVHQTNSRSSAFIRIFILTSLLVCVYTFTNAGKFHIVDEVSLYSVTESVALHGAVDTNAIAWTQFVNSPGEVLGAFGHDGQVYSKKGPAPAFIAVPLHWLLQGTARLGVTVPFVQTMLLWNGLITALTAALLWMTARRLGYDDGTGLRLGLLFGLCTIAWPYANHFFGEPLSALSLLASFYGLLSWKNHIDHHSDCRGHRVERVSNIARTEAQEQPPDTDGRQISSIYRQGQREGIQWLWLAGIGAGVAVATVTAHILLIAILGLYLLIILTRPKTCTEQGRSSQMPNAKILASMSFIIPVITAGLLLFAYNQVRFGNPLDTGYHFDTGEGFTTPAWQGLWGLLVSPYRGVFWHTPLFIASLPAFYLFTHRHRMEGLTIAGLSVVLISLYSIWWMWWGGFAWGPRFLVPLTPFWILLLAPLLSTTRHHLVPSGSADRALSLRHIIPLLPRPVALLAVLSFLVQLMSVSVNYVNYEIRLRSIFETDWTDPLAFGPPAQRLTDWQHSPVLGQFYLATEDFSGHTDLAWLRADGTVLWPVLMAGLVAIILLSLSLARLPRSSTMLSSRHFVIPVLFIIPIFFIIIWVANVRSEPHYGMAHEGYRAALAQSCLTSAMKASDRGLITVAPFAYQIPMNWLPSLCSYPPGVTGLATSATDYDQMVHLLTSRTETFRDLWLITGGLPPNAPENSVERWLVDHAYKATDEWFGDYRLVRYSGTGPVDGRTSRSRLQQSVVLWGTDDGGNPQQVKITSAEIGTGAPLLPGTVLPLLLRYRLSEPVVHDLRWFAQLLAADGSPAALLDSAPQHGYVAFSQLATDSEHVERLGLYLPTDLAAGTYRAIIGLYDPQSAGAPRWRTTDGADFIEIALFELDVVKSTVTQ